jgi:hypothetical protein
MSLLKGVMMDMVMLSFMMMKTLSPCQQSSIGDDGVDFPSVAATEQQDLPSSQEEESFRLCHRPRIIREI